MNRISRLWLFVRQCFSIEGYGRGVVQLQCNTVNYRILPSGFKIESEEYGFSARFNGDGAWCTARLDGNFYRRCVDGRVLRNSELSSDIAAQSVQDRLSEVILRLSCDREDAVLQGALNSIVSSSRKDFSRLRGLYDVVYPEGVPVLPPDRYRDYVVPLTLGCPNGRCSFCAFYRDRPFRVFSQGLESPQNLNSHLERVKVLVGESRDGVFLGSANALAAPEHYIRAMLLAVPHHFGDLPRGVACFADADHISRRNREALPLFAGLGVQLVVLGLETGSSLLRGKLNKKADTRATCQLVKALQTAGISVGLTVLTGFLASDDFDEHLAGTLSLIEGLALQTNDKVYVSPWFGDGADHPGLRAITEMEAMKSALRRVTCARVTGYSSNNFYYFS